jgi:hypothetical protein
MPFAASFTLHTILMTASLAHFMLASGAHAQSLSAAKVAAVSRAVFEVVVLKPTTDSLSYERPLPLDQIPYAIRKDPYYSVGTAFAVGPNRWVTAAHVLSLGQASLQKTYRLRDSKGRVYDIDKITELSLRRDFAVFSIKGDLRVKPLAMNSSPRPNDRVFAVGNALGQGIVFRDGLYTSETPEERDGQWKWIRFSAATSPGNSGGPLLDREGRVIGVVVRKSANENLNYALPVREFLEAKERVADIDTQILYRIDNLANLTHLESLRSEIALPKSYSELDAEMIPLFDKFGQKLKDELFRKERERIFPKGKSSAALLNSTYNAVLPGLVALGNDGEWDAFFANKKHTGDLGANGRLTYADNFFSSEIFSLTKPDNVKLEALYSDSKELMDLMLRGKPLYRTIGAEGIRIVSMGKAAEESVHVDAYGRKWLVRIWNIEEGDQRVALFALPVPGGLAGMVRRTSTAQMAGHLIDLRAFTDFIYLTYYGTIEQWRELLAQRDLMPRAFDDIRIDAEYGKRFEYSSRRLSFSYGSSEMSITPRSDLRLKFSYFMDNGKVAWDVAQVEAGDDRDNSTVFTVTRVVRPEAQLDDKFQSRWDNIARRKSPYDKSIVFEDKRTLVGGVLAPGKSTADLVNAPLLYTAYYTVDGKAEQAGVKSKLDVFLEKLTVREY